MWYDLSSIYNFQGDPNFLSRSDVTTSRRCLIDWLRSLKASTGVPLSRTILAGFSQGGAMTLDVGLQLPLAGLMVLSGYLHAPLPSGNQTYPPILIVHGRQDSVIPLRAAHQTRDRLLDLGATVEYHEFDMGHEVQPIVFSQMRSFMVKIASSTR